MADHPAVAALQKASRGLLFPSESEAPLEPFLWPNGTALTRAALLERTGAEKGAAVEELTLASLFRVVPSEDRSAFDALAKVLGEQLSGLKAYKIGAEAEKQVVVVGKTADGHWAGVRTTVVET